MVMSIWDNLRQAIWPLHEQAEHQGPLHRLLDGQVALDDYKQILDRIYGIILPFEGDCRQLADGGRLGFDIRGTFRSQALANDLLHWGHSHRSMGAIARCESRPVLDSPGKALGWLYLSEGSRLGGLMLADRIIDQFGLENYQGCAYFSSAGDDVAQLWAEFKAVAGEHYNSTDLEEISRSARDCFKCFNQWIQGE